MHDAASSADRPAVEIPHALGESEARLRTLLDTMTEAVASLTAVRGADGRITGFEVQLLNRAGARLPAPVELRPPGSLIALDDPQIAGVMRALAEVVETGEPRTMRLGSLTDGIVVDASVVRLGDGVVVVGRDVTAATLEQRRAESLGAMAAGVAHDFNNLLAGVIGHAELAMLAVPPDSPAHERLERITVAAQRAAELTRSLLDNAGSRSGCVELVDVDEIVLETVRLHEAAPPATVRVEVRTSRDGAPVLGDATQLHRLVANLVLNASDAVDATGRAGTVTVQVRVEDHDHAPVGAGGDGLAPGRYVTLVVADEGVGMSPSTMLRMFDPFFTTRAAGRGLGLAIARGVARAHRGVIVPASVEGVGTTMTVHLPAAIDETPR